jgi:predicted Zn-dependent protease
MGKGFASLGKRWIAVWAALVIAVNGVLNPALMTSAWAQGQGRSLAFVRDAEIEGMIRTLATPLWQAAGLDPGSVTITLVNDPRLNAFVSGGQKLFINTGLLLRTAHPGQVLGVLAHETGHISGGHLARLPEAYRNAMITSLIAMALGVGAAIAGGGGAAGAAILGGSAMGQSSFFAFTRSQESAADQAGISLLEATRQSPRGFLEFMEILANQEFLAVGRQDPYLRTHPLSQERVEFLRNQVALSRFADAPLPPDQVAAHRIMKAKLYGFLEPPGNTLARYSESDGSVEARYARAIANYRIPNLKVALPLIDGLIEEAPNNPFFHELRGQMLYENQRAAEALPSYQRAVELLPGSGLLRIDLSQVMIELNDPKNFHAARLHLAEAERLEPNVPRVWRLKGIILGRENKLGEAAAALAEEALMEGRLRDARDQARRAIRLLPADSIIATRAQDIEAEALREIAKK